MTRKPHPITVDSTNHLRCPTCGGTDISVESVTIAGHPDGDDRPVVPVTVYGDSGITIDLPSVQYEVALQDHQIDLTPFPPHKVNARTKPTSGVSLTVFCVHCGNGKTFRLTFLADESKTLIEVPTGEGA